jgi:hypothetical protein
VSSTDDEIRSGWMTTPDAELFGVLARGLSDEERRQVAEAITRADAEADQQVCHLIADLQVGGDLRHRTTRGDQIEDLAAELRSVTAAAPSVHPRGRQMFVLGRCG